VNKKLIAALLVVNLFLSATTAIPVLADGAAFPSSMYHDLYESAQKAVILYGNCTGNCTEHLILSVSFEGDAEDFAWVVPVPNKPEITVSNPELFQELSNFTRTEIPHGRFECFGGYAPGGQEGVDVIEEQVVGPYATAILSATNATALVDWLNANGYTFPEDGEEIISEYIEKEWYFVATRINAIDNDTGYALAEGAIEPIVLSFASDEIVYPLRISSLSATNATSPEVLLYVLTDHVVVPEQYPLYIGYGNWTENAFTLEFGDNVSVEDLSEYEILPELVSTYLPSDEFYLTKLRGWISADQMVDIEMVTYEEGDSLGSLAETNANREDVVVLTMIVGPVFVLYLWQNRRRPIV
jgi:hypothetical protein